MAYLANDKYNAVLSSGYTVGQGTLSVSAVPDNVPTIVVLAKGTDNETVFSVTGKTINSLTGVARLRGANVDLDAQTPITCLNNEEFINQYASAVFTLDNLKDLFYGVDGGSTDDYEISLDPAPALIDDGMLIAFLANTANTGASTLDVNSLGAIAIKKKGTLALETGDILAGQTVLVVFDGTNFQLVSTIDSSRKDGAIMAQVYPGTNSLSTGDGKLYIPIPVILNGFNLSRVFGAVITAGTTNTTDIQFARIRSGTPADMLSTKLTIDSGETDSSTGATPAVINTSNDDVATNDLIRIDIDQVSTTAPKGLVVTLEFAKP